jgi:histidine triad (HIT) family protein
MTAGECPFCRIAAGDLEAEVVFKDQELTAFWDHRPGAPVHILIIPNRHYTTLNDVSEEDAGLLGRMVLKARELAAEFKVDQSGYRIFMNTGYDGGQSVFHMHLHLMGGRHLGIYRPG